MSVRDRRKTAIRTLSLAAQSLRTYAVRGIERYLHFRPYKLLDCIGSFPSAEAARMKIQSLASITFNQSEMNPILRLRYHGQRQVISVAASVVNPECVAASPKCRSFGRLVKTPAMAVAAVLSIKVNVVPKGSCTVSGRNERKVCIACDVTPRATTLSAVLLLVFRFML